MFVHKLRKINKKMKQTKINTEIDILIKDFLIDGKWIKLWRFVWEKHY